MRSTCGLVADNAAAINELSAANEISGLSVTRVGATVSLSVTESGVIHTDSVTFPTAQIPVPRVANATIDVQDVNDNDIVSTTTVRADAVWGDTGDGSFTLLDATNISSVVIRSHANLEAGSNSQRTNAIMMLEVEDPANPGVFNEVEASSSGYMRGLTVGDHGEASHDIFHRENVPVTGATYRLASGQEAVAGVVNVENGEFDLVAYEDITVLVP